ncbi:MAG: HesA/MoeB/ThiF family protein [Candidatus Latescibacterota bacterium]
MRNFTENQMERYSRHILLQDVGVEGQIKIMDSKVLIIGAGGLGAPAALYLAAAGIGRIGIVDSDRVELSNLQRQVIHFTKDLDTPKVRSAEEKMRAINPDVEIRAYHEFVRAGTVKDILKGWDFVIDGTDNFSAKFLINDACVMSGIPYSHGGILRFNGQTMTVIPGKSACYRCIFPAPPPKDAVPTCSQAGVLGAVAGMLGTIQAAEALKQVMGIGLSLADKLLTFNALTMDFRKITIRRRPDCELCGDNPLIHDLVDEEQPVCSLKLNKQKGRCQ